MTLNQNANWANKFPPMYFEFKALQDEAAKAMKLKVSSRRKQPATRAKK